MAAPFRREAREMGRFLGAQTNLLPGALPSFKWHPNVEKAHKRSYSSQA